MKTMKCCFLLLIVFVFSGIFSVSGNKTPESKRPKNVPKNAFFYRDKPTLPGTYSLTEKNNGRTVRRLWEEDGTLILISVIENGRTRTQYFAPKSGLPIGPKIMDLIPPRIKTKMEALSRAPTIRPLSVPAKATYNRRIWSHGKTVNGKRDGKWLFWHRDGEYAGFMTYKNGVRHGKFKLRRTNGKILLQGTKENGKTLNSKKTLEEQRKKNLDTKK